MILFDPVLVFTDTEVLIVSEGVWYELRWLGNLFAP